MFPEYEKLNSENRAENIEALRTRLRQTEEQLTSETDSRKRADAEVVAWKFKYEKAEQAKRYAQTHQKTVEVPVEKKVPYEKCDNCDRIAYQKAKEKCDDRKIQLEKKYKNMTVAYESILFLLAWYSIATTLFTVSISCYYEENEHIKLQASDDKVHMIYFEPETVIVGNQKRKDSSYHANLQDVLKQEFLRRSLHLCESSLSAYLTFSVSSHHGMLHQLAR